MNTINRTSTWRARGSIAARVALLLGAAWALRRELVTVRSDRLLAALRAYKTGPLALAVGCAVASFVVMGIVEVLALREIADAPKPRIPLLPVLVTSFVANALSQSMGVALLTGAAVRARSYARRQVGAAAIGQITAFVTLTATLGLLAASAVALVVSGSALRVGHFALAAYPLAGVFGGMVLAYLAWSAFGTNDGFGRGRWHFAQPTSRVALAQVGLSLLDWLLVGTILYALLPSTLGLGYIAVIGAYMVAQTIGMTSHVPAGAGVFEVVMLTLVARGTGDADRAAVVASLVVFRVLYYLAPLLLAMIIAGASEWRRRFAAPVTLSPRAAHAA